MMANCARNSFAPLAMLALALMIGAFVLEHGFNAVPCTMCWWQRYVHWAIAAVALAGMLPAMARWRGVLVSLLMLLPVVGAGIAIWQSGAQWGWWTLPEICGDSGAQLAIAADFMHALESMKPVPSCAARGFTIFGVTLAEWNIGAMALCCGLAWQLKTQLKKKV